MHIAFLTPEYPHARIQHAAGIGTSIKNLVTALVEKGIAVTVFVYGQKEAQIFKEAGITFHLIENKTYPFGKWYFYRKHIQKYVNEVILKEGIQLIEAPDWTGITAFMKLRVPLVIRFHGSDTYFCYLEKRKQKWKNHWFETLAVRKAQAYIAPTSYAGKVSAALFGIPEELVKTIHYGLALEQFRNDEPELYENKLLLYVGTLIRKKGVLELPAIFHKVKEIHPEARLVLIGGDSGDLQSGSTSTWQLMQDLIPAEDKPFVSYLGKIPYVSIQEYIKKAHVCVFPTFAETLGMVTIESMGMQKPVVNSNIGWAQELIIDGESGFLVHPENHEHYASQISLLFSDPKLCKEIGVAARKRVENVFDIEAIVQQNISFYENLLLKK